MKNTSDKRFTCNTAAAAGIDICTYGYLSWIAIG